jgi:predicted nucleotidyltransferase
MKIIELRRKLINWLAGEGITVVINTTVYDYVLEANDMMKDCCLFRRNKVVSLDEYVDKETDKRMNLAKQGIRRRGNAYMLDPRVL